MDAFENIVATILQRQGWWTRTSFRVELTKEEKRNVGRHSTPRWEIDLVAYKGATNEVLAVECKSFLDSRGVLFADGSLLPQHRFKLFCEERLREVVLKRLGEQLAACNLCRPSPQMTLCLAAGKIASNTDLLAMKSAFQQAGWRLFDPQWIVQHIRDMSSAGYENDIAFTVAKLLIRNADAESAMDK